MNTEFSVSPQERGWIVRRGRREVRAFVTRDLAVKAADSFARAAAVRGDSATVRVFEDGELREERSFASDLF